MTEQHRKNEEKKKHKILVHGRLSATTHLTLTCSFFMLVCLGCLTLVDTDVLLLHAPAAVVIMVLLLYCGWLCGVATTAALVHEET